MAGTEPFVVMAKPVGPHCNLHCSYCYYLNTGSQQSAPTEARMSDDVLDNFIRQYIMASPGPIVQFSWHGGEPTLAGLDFFRHAVELQKKYLPEGWSCWNNLQTNGLLLDNEWCDFLAINAFDVGLSLDGTPQIHDQFRTDRMGRGSYEHAAGAVRRLQAHGIQPDLLCTVTSAAAAAPLEVYRTLRAFNTGWIQFIPIVRRSADGQVTADSISGDAYGQFLCAVFDEWADQDIGRLEIQQIAEISLVLAGGTTNLCWMAPTCGRVLVVEQDGSVFACDHFVNPAHRLGNILDSQLGDLAELPRQRRFGHDKRDALPDQCRKCHWLSLCQGGCPKDRFAKSSDGEAGLNHLCDGQRLFFAHAAGPLQQIVELRRRGLAPDAIRAELRAAAQIRWQGVGRNDPCPCGSGRKAKNCCMNREHLKSRL